MSTIRLYEQSAYQTTFTATVLHCTPKKSHWEIVLDQTCFYPEGGGQPSDRGTLGGAAVLDVQLVGDEVVHTTAAPLTEGTAVTGEVDWSRRFDLMQQHSGEHIVSGIIHRLYGYDNVGFHMGEDVVTVDWNGTLTRQQLVEVEQLANQVIWRNLPTEILIPPEEALEALDYRSKKALDWPVRIVTFPEADSCACCGTHVSRAGEIGLIRLLSVVRMRGGIRVEMLCGQRALAHTQALAEQNHAISTLLSAKELGTAAAVTRLYDEQQSLKARCATLETACHAALAEQYRNSGNCLLLLEEMDTNALRRLTVAVMEVCGGVCAAFSPRAAGGYAYCIGEKDGDVRTLVKQVNQQLQGRGGGKPHFAQGSIAADRETLTAFFATTESPWR